MSPPISLYILAGGRSSRFGSNKALADFRGRPLLHHVIHQFPQLPPPILVANQKDDYLPLGLSIIPDPIPELGPIGGLLAACQHLPTAGWILLSGCDTFFTDPDAAAQLLSAAADAAVAVQAIAFKGPHWEPLPALYHAAILPRLRDYVDSGGRSLWRLIEEVPHRALPFLHPQSPVLHINTPEDLLKLHP